MRIDYKNPPKGMFVYGTQSHFDDLDAQWILHHSRQIRYVERAQQAMFNQIMEMPRFDPYAFPDLNMVVRKLDVDYLKPLMQVRPFMIVMWVTRLREAGMTTAFEFRSIDGEELYTKGLRTVCKISLKEPTPVGWTPAFRERHQQWLDWAQSALSI